MNTVTFFADSTLTIFMISDDQFPSFIDIHYLTGAKRVIKTNFYVLFEQRSEFWPKFRNSEPTFLF